MRSESKMRSRYFELHRGRGDGAAPSDSRPIPTARMQGQGALRIAMAPESSSSEQKEIYVSVRSERDLLTACQKAQALAAQLGLPSREKMLLSSVLSELARNILRCSRRGETVLRAVHEKGRWVVVVAAFA